MALVTRCPACSTMFKLVPDHIRVAAGWVRCGQCGEVFDSSTHMLSYDEARQHEASLEADAADAYDTRPMLPDDFPPTEIQNPYDRHDEDPYDWPEESLDGGKHDQAPDSAHDENPDEEQDNSPDSEPDKTPDGEREYLLPDASQISARTQQLRHHMDALPVLDVRTDQATASQPEPDQPAAPQATPQEPEEPQEPQEPQEPEEPEIVTGPPASAPPAGDLEQVLPEQDQPQDIPQDEPQAAPEDEPEDESEDEPEDEPQAQPSIPPAPEEPPPDDEDEDRYEDKSRPRSKSRKSTPSFVAKAKRRARRRRRRSSPMVGILLAMALLLLALALAWQAAISQRDWLAARQPQLAPALQRMCRLTGCSVQPYRQLSAIVIDSSAFNRTGDESFRFSVTLINKADLPVASPALELTLTDAQEQTLARRVVTAADLGAPPALPARDEFTGSYMLNVSASSNPAAVTGYRVTAFYP